MNLHDLHEYVNDALAIVATLIALCYWRRLIVLNVWDHKILFVAQNTGALIVSGYSAYVLLDWGVYPLPVMAAAMCGLFYMGTQRAYEQETRPGFFDSRPIAINVSDWPRVVGRGDGG